MLYRATRTSRLTKVKKKGTAKKPVVEAVGAVCSGMELFSLARCWRWVGVWVLLVCVDGGGKTGCFYGGLGRADGGCFGGFSV